MQADEFADAAEAMSDEELVERVRERIDTINRTQEEIDVFNRERIEREPTTSAIANCCVNAWPSMPPIERISRRYLLP